MSQTRQGCSTCQVWGLAKEDGRVKIRPSHDIFTCVGARKGCGSCWSKLLYSPIYVRDRNGGRLDRAWLPASTSEELGVGVGPDKATVFKDKGQERGRLCQAGSSNHQHTQDLGLRTGVVGYLRGHPCLAAIPTGEREGWNRGSRLG